MADVASLLAEFQKGIEGKDTGLGATVKFDFEGAGCIFLDGNLLTKSRQFLPVLVFRYTIPVKGWGPFLTEASPDQVHSNKYERLQWCEQTHLPQGL